MATEPKTQSPKGILKKPKPSFAPPSSTIALLDDDDDDEANNNNSTSNRIRARLPRSQEEIKRIALHHARLIQQRKDIEAQITESILRLTELPAVRDPVARSAADPAPADVAEFRSLVRLFQPTDYDDLIAERNTCGLCGYALCPLPRRTFGPNAGTFKLVNVGSADFDIVRREELERWCSRQCARRALYVKVQLNETGAWEGTDAPDLVVDLLDEADGKKLTADPVDGQLARDVGRLKLEEERKANKDAAVLALERGDNRRLGGRNPVQVTLREKSAILAPQEPTISGGSDNAEEHLMLEGHKVTIDAGQIDMNQDA